MAKSGSESHRGGSKIKGSTKAKKRKASTKSFMEQMKSVSFADVPF